MTIIIQRLPTLFQRNAFHKDLKLILFKFHCLFDSQTKIKKKLHFFIYVILQDTRQYIILLIYISLYIYLSIHLDLFSDILKKGCNLLTHHLASNIIYHIDKLGVLIDRNILKLLRMKKNTLIILVRMILFKK